MSILHTNRRSSEDIRLRATGYQYQSIFSKLALFIRRSRKKKYFFFVVHINFLYILLYFSSYVISNKLIFL